MFLVGKCDDLSISAHILTYVGTIIIVNQAPPFLSGNLLVLIMYVQILGTGMSAKMWEVTVEHARTCVIDKRVYLYCPPTSQLKTGVVFNLVGQVMGLLSDCQYVPIEKLSETEKAKPYFSPWMCSLYLLYFFNCFFELMLACPLSRWMRTTWLFLPFSTGRR